MRTFEKEEIVVRDIKEAIIVFWDKSSIYVYPATGIASIYHRWFAPSGSYTGGWKQFRQNLMRGKMLDLPKIRELAAKYGILVVGTNRKLDLSKERVKYL